MVVGSRWERVSVFGGRWRRMQWKGAEGSVDTVDWERISGWMHDRLMMGLRVCVWLVGWMMMVVLLSLV